LSKRTIIHIEKGDDITSVVERLKDARTEVVGIVGDKGSSVFNSPVNVKLLDKTAKKHKKSLVLVSDSSKLEPLAGTLRIKIAKNLDDTPFIPAKPVEMDKKEIVIGAKKKKAAINKEESKVKEAKIEEAPKPVPEEDTNHESEDLPKVIATTESSVESKPAKSLERKGISIPSFDKFRNKVIFGILSLALLIGLWFVAFFVLPSADINLKIRTSELNVSESITISDTFGESNFATNNIKAQKAIVTKEETKEFTPTGEKNNGDKAKGEVEVKNLNSSTTENFVAGTKFIDNDGLVFTADNDFSVGPAQVSGGTITPGSGTVDVTAEKPGEDYNIGSNESLSIDNSSGAFTAESVSIKDGTDDKVNVVTQEDVDSTVATFSKPVTPEIEAELNRQFSQEVLVLEDSFKTEVVDIKSDPSVDDEGSEAKLTVTVIYTMYGIDKLELKDFAQEKAQLDPSGAEKIFDVDTNSVVAKITKDDDSSIDLDINISTFIGPEISEDDLAELVTGKGFSETIETLEDLPGISKAEVDFSPFWVSSAPRESKISFTTEVDE